MIMRRAASTPFLLLALVLAAGMHVMVAAHGSTEDAACEEEYGPHCPVGWDWLAVASKSRGCSHPPCCAPSKAHPGNAKCTTIEGMGGGSKWSRGHAPEGLKAKQDWEATCGIFWPTAPCPEGWAYSAAEDTCGKPPSYKGKCSTIKGVDNYSPAKKYAWSLTCSPSPTQPIDWVCPQKAAPPGPPHPHPAPRPPSNPNNEAMEVFVVFGNHLDLGCALPQRTTFRLVLR